MGILSLILGVLGGLCAVVGILTAVEDIIPEEMPDAFTAEVWLMLAIVILLGCIAAAISRAGTE